MAITANSGPEILFGITVSASGATTQYNEQRGPSLVDLGDALLDPRAQYNYGYTPGNAVTSPTFGFWGLQGIVDYIPGAISSNNLATTSTGNGGGVPLTLTAGTGITQMTSIIAPETGKTAGTVFTIDAACGGSTNAGVFFGSAATIGIWNPASVCGRCITISASAAGDGGTWTIAGRDVYGFKVTEQIAAPFGSGSATSKKAYKYISSIIPCTTLQSTAIMVGTADTYGFPLLVQHPAYINIWLGATSSATLVTANTGNHAFGSSLPTATSTNGDVRGTYASSIASNGTTMRVQMFVSPSVGPGAASLSSYAGLNQIGATSWYTLFGATQFSSV
jgi:hypothetical protein